MQARFTGLRSSIDPAYAASLRFADAQMITQRAVAAGIATEAEAAAVLDGLRSKMDLAAGAAGRFETAQMAAGRSAQANAMVTGNVAAQFNDIGVMLASGQNPFMLAIQQGTQLSQVLNQVGGGAKGAVAALKAGFVSLLSPTTLLTMAVIAGGAALVQWATSADVAEEKSAEMKSRIDELATALRDLDSATNAAGEPISKLVSKYGDLAGAVRDARLQMADRAFLDARDKFNGLVEDTNFGATMQLVDLQALATAQQQIDALRQKMAAARATAEATGTFYDDTADSEALARLINKLQGAATYVGAIRDEFGLTQDQAQGLAVALARMNEAGDAHEQVATAKAFNAELIKVFGSARAADAATGGMVTALAEAIEKGADLAALSGQITGRFQEGEGAVGAITARLDEALGFAESLASADIAGNISAAPWGRLRRWRRGCGMPPAPLRQRHRWVSSSRPCAARLAWVTVTVPLAPCANGGWPRKRPEPKPGARRGTMAAGFRVAMLAAVRRAQAGMALPICRRKRRRSWPILIWRLPRSTKRSRRG